MTRAAKSSCSALVIKLEDVKVRPVLELNLLPICAKSKARITAESLKALNASPRGRLGQLPHVHFRLHFLDIARSSMAKKACTSIPGVHCSIPQSINQSTWYIDVRNSLWPILPTAAKMDWRPSIPESWFLSTRSIIALHFPQAIVNQIHFTPIRRRIEKGIYYWSVNKVQRFLFRTKDDRLRGPLAATGSMHWHSHRSALVTRKRHVCRHTAKKSRGSSTKREPS